MFVNRLVKVLLLLLGGVFVLLQGFAFEVEGQAVGALLLILLTILYCGWTKNKTMFFFWFLVTFMIAQSLNYVSYYLPEISENQIDYYYYGANILYILSYLFLIVKIVLDLNFKKVFKELAVPIVILVVLDVFCVTLVTDTTQRVLSTNEYILEFVYNAVIMVLLSVALLNYMYRNDNKSILFLIGSICIVFSEIIQLAYYYIIADKNLGFIYAFFLVVAFIFFYIQSQLEFTGPEHVYYDEHFQT